MYPMRIGAFALARTWSSRKSCAERPPSASMAVCSRAENSGSSGRRVRIVVDDTRTMSPPSATINS
jgi:hypothetical protein